MYVIAYVHDLINAGSFVIITHPGTFFVLDEFRPDAIPSGWGNDIIA